ncbi:MAG TPA: hypothetical protein VJZ71_19140 [Phycisphaerae bacterium]|nr:hypothetical protein [Phycisphaerae bacterium]
MDQLQSFGLNIHILIGILMVLAIGMVLVIAVWTGVKVWLFRKQQEDAKRNERRSKIGRDGCALPPRGAGFCERCQKAGQVFHLPDGRRLCETCYETHGHSATAAVSP